MSEAGLFVDCGLDNKNPFYAAEKAEKCPKKPCQKLKLTSDKMKGLRELLAAEKFNVGAIQLQVTAQSNTADDSIFSRPKRSRREWTNQWFKLVKSSVGKLEFMKISIPVAKIESKT